MPASWLTMLSMSSLLDNVSLDRSLMFCFTLSNALPLPSVMDSCLYFLSASVKALNESDTPSTSFLTATTAVVMPNAVLRVFPTLLTVCWNSSMFFLAWRRPLDIWLSAVMVTFAFAIYDLLG